MPIKTVPRHPAYFQPPAPDLRLSPVDFRGITKNLGLLVDRIAKEHLARYNFTDLELLGDNAPDSFEELAHAAFTRPYGNKFPIYHGHCEKTIFHTNCANTWYRAWHDLVHIETPGKFTLVEELNVVNAQLAEMARYGASAVERCIVWMDIMGQLLYFHKYRDYAVEQKAFVEAACCKGLKFALAYRW